MRRGRYVATFVREAPNPATGTLLPLHKSPQHGQHGQQHEQTQPTETAATETKQKNAAAYIGKIKVDIVKPATNTVHIPATVPAAVAVITLLFTRPCARLVVIIALLLFPLFPLKLGYQRNHRWIAWRLSLSHIESRQPRIIPHKE